MKSRKRYERQEPKGSDGKRNKYADLSKVKPGEPRLRVLRQADEGLRLDEPFSIAPNGDVLVKRHG